MKLIKLFEQILTESNEKMYAIVPIGGDPADENPKNPMEYKGLDASEEELFSLDDAKKEAKRINRRVNWMDKKYYGLRYIVVPVKNGVFE